ncbi:hypothetical protein HK101_004661 [Irineochytrium annulatum]|nr:hypothetical protein HK101_004661 [Irineochytrium annulatum]
MRRRRYYEILDEAFGDGGWELKPSTKYHFTSDKKNLSRTYTLSAQGRFLSEATGDRSFALAGLQAAALPEVAKLGLDHHTLTARCAEGFVEYSALVRCCKDLAIAWQLWDKDFVMRWQGTLFAWDWILANDEDNDGYEEKCTKRKKDEEPKMKKLWKVKKAENGLVESSFVPLLKSSFERRER